MTRNRPLNPVNSLLLSTRATVWLAALVACIALLAAGPGCQSSPLGGQNAPAGYAAPGAAPLADEATGASRQEQLARDVEEADIVKIVGDTLYALNRFKGLLVVDVANPDAPALVGELDLRGRGVEMYVRATQAYVVLSADFYYPYLAGAANSAMPIVADGPVPPPPDFEGSKLAIIDVADPTAPELTGQLNLVGFANESRRVGDVIYVVGSNFVPWAYAGEEEGEVDEGFVASINVADPENIIAVQRETFAGESLNIHVSDTTLFAASHDYDFENSETLTHVQVIDISDPDGVIVVRGTVDVPGHIRNRFFMDDFDGVFRIVTEGWGFGFNMVRLYTYDLTDLDAITALGQTDIIQDESLRAVRFDGPRGFVVTFFQMDPLFVIDLQDPANPAVTGELEVPGYSTHIEPRGNRLIAVGIDDTDGWRPAVSYYDVEDPANPTELGRVVLGPPGSFTESEAVYDEKAFKVVDELGLIAIPFRHVAWPDLPLDTPDGTSSSEILPDDYGPECTNAVQLVDFSDAALVQRGYFEHRGNVQRVGVIGDRLFALSQVCLQTVDISNRDEPTQAGQADFFDEDDLPFYADDCGGWIEWPGNGQFRPLEGWLDSGFCGTIGILSGGFVPVCLWFSRSRTKPRRQYRR
ncbi:MAG: beta-propeller domain-containing protein [Planctomycetota bacterium]